jgi:selenocysteine lyase/cysteine desulfurase
VTFAVDGVAATEVSGRLRAQAINTSVTPVEYAQFDRAPRVAGGLVRASVHYYNTDEELEALRVAVEGMARPS